MKKNNRDPKFLKGLINIDYQNPTKEFIGLVHEVVNSPEFQPETLTIKIYQTCKQLCDWFSHMNN